jgi:hypothetical protein
MNEVVENPVTPAAQIPVEEKRLAQEAELKRAELALKEREIAAKEAELQRSRWLNPTVLGLFAAAIGLIGNVVVAWYNSRSSREVAHNQAQSSLILQAVTTGNYASACQNLVSLIKLGLVDDPKGSLQRCTSGEANIPVLPINNKTYTPVVDDLGETRANIQRAMNVKVTRTAFQDKVLFHVTFTVPPADALVKTYDLILVYAFKVGKAGQNVQQIDLPEIHGSWKPGDSVGFDVQLPRVYVDDVKNYPSLRFCVGYLDSCYPSQNLLLSEASSSSNP